MTNPLASDVFDITGLVTAVDEGLVRAKVHPDGHTHLLEYAERVQYERLWTPEIMACRGLILSEHPSHPEARVLARPFAKFANAGEHQPGSVFGPVPTGPFEVTEKLDGSLIIAFDRGRGPEFSTRGSFTSVQAEAAARLWSERFTTTRIPAGVTALFELIAPWNRVVVPYENEELVLLAVLDNVTHADIGADWWGGPRVRRFDVFSSFAELLDEAASGAAGDEGFVVRFLPEDPGRPSQRVKIKYAEYVRLHRVLSGLSTVSVWETLTAGGDLRALLDVVPDELYGFVEGTAASLHARHEAMVGAARALADEVRGLERKEAAARITGQREVPTGLVFAALDHKDVEAAAWRRLRPEREMAEWGTVAQ